MDDSWAMYHPTLETVLAAHEERAAILRQDGRMYIDIELVCSLVDQTLETNAYAHRDKLDDIRPYLEGLATGTRFAAELLTYASFTDDLEQLE